MSRIIDYVDSLPLRDYAAICSATLSVCFALHYYAAPDKWQRWFHGLIGARLALGVAMLAFVALAGVIAFAFRSPSPTPALPITEHKRFLAGQGDAYVLEIRNVDLSAQRWGGVALWRTLQKLADPNRSFLTHEDPTEAYPTQVNDASLTNTVLFGAMFRTVASFAVEYWPVPTFIAGPKHHPAMGRPADGIITGRMAATLGVTMFLWQDDEQTTSTQGMIERLFAFFDANPDVPEALIVANDGDYVRFMSGGAPGSGNLKGPLGKPDVLQGNVALLVSRSDRVDAYVRPHALADRGDINPRDTKDDLSTFWHFYHHYNASAAPDSFITFYEAQHADKPYFVSTPTISTAYWHKQLPKFWEKRRDRHYIGSPFLPVRWTGGQLRKFDKAPLVGYLHRPVRVPLRDENGSPLSRKAVVANLRAGYDRAVAPLANGRKPTRLFYDSSHDMQWAVTVMEALKDLPDGGPDPTQEGDAYDLHYRIGNLGAVSALGQIALAAMAGHDDGRVSITLNTGEANGDHADFIVVTPPDEEQLQKNRDRTSSRTLLGGF